MLRAIRDDLNSLLLLELLATEGERDALRLVDGFDEQLFVERTRLPLTELRGRLAPLAQRGLVAGGSGGLWRPTAKGHAFLNDLQAHFLPD